MARLLRVLHLQNRRGDADLVRNRLELGGLSCDISLADSSGGYDAALRGQPFDLIISNCSLPGYDGVAALEKARELQPGVAVILISGTPDEHKAVEGLHDRAAECLTPERIDRLAPAARRAIAEAESGRRHKQSEHALVQREQTLRAHEERTTAALAAARMGVWEVDLAADRLTWSETTAPVFGLTPGDAPRSMEGFRELIHPDDRSVVAASIERTLSGEGDFAVDFRAMWPDGSTHWVHGRAQAACDAAGNPLRLRGIVMDIERQKSLEHRRNQTTEALQTAQHRMRLALEAAGVGIWEMDYTTGHLTCSDILESQYGRQPGTFGGTFDAFVECIHPDDRERTVATVERAMNTGADFTILNRSLWSDGTVRWLSGAGHVFLGESGEPLRSVGISQDVTERKRAEASLSQSEKRKAAVLASVLDCIVTMDAHGSVIEFNAAAERTFGYTNADVIGRPLAELIIPPPLRAKHTAGLAHYLASGEGPLLGKVIEVVAMRSDGSEIPVELSITAIHSDKDPMFTGVLRDITARKLGEETRARLAAIVDSSDDAIFSMALDDTILTWNGGAERLYGYPASEVIGRSRALLVPPEKADELAVMLEKAMRGEAGEPVETRRRRRDGSSVDISLTVSPMTDASGRVTGISTIARDITSRKKAEAELQRLNEEVQLQRLRVFKATIRTVQDIVNNLLNSFQILRLEGEAQLSPDMLALVDGMIDEASSRLQSLGDLESVKEKEMIIGLGIEYPGSAF